MTVAAAQIARVPNRSGMWYFVRRNPTLVGGLFVLALVALAALMAPLIAGDPILAKPVNRLRPPSQVNWLGTDQL
ncbi:MAG TPA: ABC transporter permease, partial [Hyphomicrobiaceae bacterium]|nr:ABC transporter permease [Hyphomicrobiaceae bacterium]